MKNPMMMRWIVGLLVVVVGAVVLWLYLKNRQRRAGAGGTPVPGASPWWIWIIALGAFLGIGFILADMLILPLVYDHYASDFARKTGLNINLVRGIVIFPVVMIVLGLKWWLTPFSKKKALGATLVMVSISAYNLAIYFASKDFVFNPVDPNQASEVFVILNEDGTIEKKLPLGHQRDHQDGRLGIRITPEIIAADKEIRAAQEREAQRRQEELAAEQERKRLAELEEQQRLQEKARQEEIERRNQELERLRQQELAWDAAARQQELEKTQGQVPPLRVTATPGATGGVALHFVNESTRLLVITALTKKSGGKVHQTAFNKSMSPGEAEILQYNQSLARGDSLEFTCEGFAKTYQLIIRQ